MKIYFFTVSFLVLLSFNTHAFSLQDSLEFSPIEKKDSFLVLLSDKACDCIDSIETLHKKNSEISNEINNCIDKFVTSYSMTSQLFQNYNESNQQNITDIDGKDDTTKKKNIEIFINTNKDSEQYKRSYYKIQEYLMENCNAIKIKVATNDEMKSYSISNNYEAQKEYTLGVDELKKNNIKEAIKYFTKAVEINEEFPFALDNLGLCYRKLNDFDKAIEYYKKSLKIDPFGITPLQNMAVAYQYKKEFDNAIDAYMKMQIVDETNPEVFYGLGSCYYNMENYEQALENLCKAYNLYIKLNSPYRVDAQKMIAYIYQIYENDNKLDEFKKVLRKHNILIGD